jgi:hypothetical protein
MDPFPCSGLKCVCLSARNAGSAPATGNAASALAFLCMPAIASVNEVVLESAEANIPVDGLNR